MPNVLDRTDQRYGRLTAIRVYGRDPQGRATWLCLCDCGVEKVVASRHLGSGRTQSCGCLQAEAAVKFGHLGRRAVLEKLGREPALKEVVGYNSAHQRVYRRKGPAKNRLCVDCGDRASHWSYDGQDTPVIENGLKFSLDVNRYEPRCVRCHSEHDRET